LGLQEKTRAAAAPRKPKNGAVSSPLNAEDIFSRIGLREVWEIDRKLLKRERGGGVEGSFGVALYGPYTFHGRRLAAY
jgi:hypothetical protein